MKKAQTLLHIFSITLLLIVGLGTPIQKTGAAVLNTPRIYLNTQKATTLSGVVYQIFFTPATSVSSGGHILISFPMTGSWDDQKWCRTAGTDLQVTGIANPTGATESAVALPTSSALAGACNYSSTDYLIIDNVGALTGGVKYGVQVQENSSSPVAILGLGNQVGQSIITITTQNSSSVTVDSSTVGLALLSNDQISVSGSIESGLTVSLNTTSINLGTVSPSANSFAGTRSRVTTGAANGYVSLVKYDVTLTSGSNTIANVTGSPPDNMTAGMNVVTNGGAYGVNTSKSGQTIAQNDADTSGCSIDGSAATTASAISATALSTSFQQFSSAASPVSNDDTTLCFLATVSGLNAPGTYQSTTTLVTTGRF